jgi:pimeloyl-ACP methyl ester carboxylesterase
LPCCENAFTLDFFRNEKLKKIIMKYIGRFFLLILIIIGILWLIPAYTSPIKDANGQIMKGSIAALEKIKLGNTEQWILVRGMDTTKPIILFLHGGPGSAAMCLYKKYTAELEKHFVVVLWDQRGAGKSFAANMPYSDMVINQFVSEACELTEKLCQRFNQKKIFLVGHSWGSAIGVLAVQKRPDLYHAYVGMGQIANMQKNELISYEWTLEQAKNAQDEDVVKTLVEMGKPPYTGDWQKKLMKQRQYLGKYGGELYGSSKGAIPLVLKRLTGATEYTLVDKVNYLRGTLKSTQLMWQELMTVNLEEQAPHLKVPIYFALGKHDYEVPFMLAEHYFNLLEAPSKELIWFENSAHFPIVEEAEKFNDLLINHVLKGVN